MERVKRKGNDRRFNWSIHVEGTGDPYDLSGKSLQLWMIHPLSKIQITDFAIQGNVISWSFLGKDQKYAGTYVALLVENNDQPGMHTLDIRNAVTLVDHSWQVPCQGEDLVDGIEDESIELSSEIDINASPSVTLEAIVEALGYTPVGPDTIAELIQAIALKQDAINDIDTIRRGAELGATALQQHQDLSPITSLIPGEASAANQLADKDFVNSSIATETAHYISDNSSPFASLAALEAYNGALTNNDYAFVIGQDASGNTQFTRFKYNANTQSWAAEYVLNNSSFTAGQWAAISSGITSGLVEKLGDLPSAAALAVALAAKYEKPASGIPASDLNEEVRASLRKAESALQSYTETDPTVPGWAKSPQKPQYTPQEIGALPDSTNIPSALSDLEDDAGHRTVSDTEKSDWNNKSDFSGAYEDLTGKPDLGILVASSIPAGGMLPNVLYDLGTLAGNTTFAFDTTGLDPSIVNHWYWTFDTPATAPTITWPAAITGWNGGTAPTIAASKHYEVSVIDGIAIFMEV